MDDAVFRIGLDCPLFVQPSMVGFDFLTGVGVFSNRGVGGGTAVPPRGASETLASLVPTASPEFNGQANQYTAQNHLLVPFYKAVHCKALLCDVWPISLYIASP